MTTQNAELREAAVLVPVYRATEGEMVLVLVRRVEGGIHGGQIGFPGGTRSPEDRTLQDTALREAAEEVGLGPGGVEILASLPVVETRTTGFRVSPFLARITAPVNWRVEAHEIAEVLEVRISDLIAPGTHGEERIGLPGRAEPQPICFYRIGQHRLWGVTYRILHPLIPRLLAGEWQL